MESTKRSRPLAVCTHCSQLTNRLQAINQRCSKKYAGKRCKGLIVSAPAEGWQECSKCLATGRVGDEKCERCGGWGWLYQQRHWS